MMDHFKEDIVSPRAKVLSNVLYVLCWVFIVLFGGYALMMLQVVMLQFSVTALVTVLMAAAFAVLLFFLKDNLKVEYEYTFTNGSLDFAKVFRQAKRKELGSMNVKNVSACGHVARGQLPPLPGDEGRGKEELVRQPRRQPLLLLLRQGKQKAHDYHRAERGNGGDDPPVPARRRLSGLKRSPARKSGRSFLSEGRNHDLFG